MACFADAAVFDKGGRMAAGGFALFGVVGKAYLDADGLACVLRADGVGLPLGGGDFFAVGKPLVMYVLMVESVGIIDGSGERLACFGFATDKHCGFEVVVRNGVAAGIARHDGAAVEGVAADVHVAGGSQIAVIQADAAGVVWMGVGMVIPNPCSVTVKKDHSKIS